MIQVYAAEATYWNRLNFGILCKPNMRKMMRYVRARDISGCFNACQYVDSILDVCHYLRSHSYTWLGSIEADAELYIVVFVYFFVTCPFFSIFLCAIEQKFQSIKFFRLSVVDIATKSAVMFANCARHAQLGLVFFSFLVCEQNS